jgi:RND family efflux transporter MFP subunit
VNVTLKHEAKRFFFWMMLVLSLSACGANAEIEVTPTKIPRAAAPIKQSYEVQRGSVTAQIQFTGRVLPVLQSDLAFPVDGRILNIYYSEGDEVAAGEVIADLLALDSLEKRKAADGLMVRQAELELENAELELELTRLRANEDIRSQEIAIKENNIELAQIRLDAMLLEIQNLEDAIADAKLIAPFDGQILSMNVEAGGNVAEFRPIATLADLSDLEIGALVQQAKQEELIEGTQVLIEAANKPGIELAGTLRRIPYRSSDVDSDDPLVRVSLPVSAEEAGLVLEDQVEVTVVVSHKEDVIWLPAQAVRTFQNNHFVVIREGDIEQRADVIIGIEGGNRVEIVSGLEVGQVVVGP